MKRIVKYFKRLIKYILYEYKQPIVNVDVYEKSPDIIFQNKVYLITGGSSGIGFSIAEKLIKNGAIVYITGRNEDKLKISSNKLGDNCHYYVGDISDTSSHSIMIDKIFSEQNRLDGIINNAGVSYHEWDFMKVDEIKFDEQFYINLKAGYFLTQVYIKKVIDNNIEYGNVLFISSERGTMCDDLPYGLTKASIDSLTKALSYKYYSKGIRVNAIAPGVTTSEMTNIKKEDDLFNNNNSGRFFISDEVAEIALFILSDYSKCISGEIIHTNAGNHIKRGY